MSSAETAAPPMATTTSFGTLDSLRTVLALIERDLTVLVHEGFGFLIRSLMQPGLFSFVFVFVFPRIGQGIGGQPGGQFASILMPGLMASSLMFQGIQAVALPLVQEFSVSREIEDRVMAPVPVKMVAIAKVISGAIQGVIAALLVMPVVWLTSGGDVSLSIHRPLVFVTLLPMAALVAAAVGLLLGTIVNPRRISFLFAVLLLPMTLLGCVYYPWSSLAAIRWLQVAVLVNPVVYFSEGLRASMIGNVSHMSLWAVYGLLFGALAVLLTVATRTFQRRCIT
jgi:ABC-2 type transport system permease protein